MVGDRFEGQERFGAWVIRIRDIPHRKRETRGFVALRREIDSHGGAHRLWLLAMRSVRSARKSRNECMGRREVINLARLLSAGRECASDVKERAVSELTGRWELGWEVNSVKV